MSEDLRLVLANGTTITAAPDEGEPLRPLGLGVTLVVDDEDESHLP